MRMTRVGKAAKGAQAIGKNFRFRGQSSGRPILHRRVVKAAHRFEHRTHGILQRFIRFHCHDKRLFVLRAASRLAAVALPTQVRIIDLHEAVQLPRLFPLGHGLHDLVLQPPGRAIAHSKMAHQLQGGHVGLGRGQQVHGQKPRSQWQLCRFEQGATQKGGLMPAGPALNLPFASKADAASMIAGGTTKAARPSRPVQSAVTLQLRAIGPHELHHRQSLLKLHLVDRHEPSPLFDALMLASRRRKSRDFWLRFDANQVLL